MFCMKCGQQLPDGAAFCMKCGTPQGAVSPTGTTNAETINLDGMHSFVPAMCPNCNSHMKVVPGYKVARCPSCGTECLVQDAIKTLNVRGNVQVGNATINVSGTNNENLLRRVKLHRLDYVTTDEYSGFQPIWRAREIFVLPSAIKTAEKGNSYIVEQLKNFYNPSTMNGTSTYICVDHMFFQVMESLDYVLSLNNPT